MEVLGNTLRTPDGHCTFYYTLGKGVVKDGLSGGCSLLGHRYWTEVGQYNNTTVYTYKIRCLLKVIVYNSTIQTP